MRPDGLIVPAPHLDSKPLFDGGAQSCGGRPPARIVVDMRVVVVDFAAVDHLEDASLTAVIDGDRDITGIRFRPVGLTVAQPHTGPTIAVSFSTNAGAPVACFRNTSTSVHSAASFLICSAHPVRSASR